MRRTTLKIDSIAGNVIGVRAPGAASGEMAIVESADMAASFAQVQGIQEDHAFLRVFSGAGGIASDSRVRFLGRPPRISCSANILGRVLRGSGVPRDDGPSLHEGIRDVASPTVNPIRRNPPSEMIRTGIPMIDLFNTLVKSQKISIFTGAGEPGLELMARIALQADSDIVILGGMGLRHDDYLFFRDTFREHGVMNRTALFMHTAADAPVECLLVPEGALTAAREFALMGRDVLVLLADMTSYCDALKEIAITMEQIPSNRGYPGDLYSRLAVLYEQAADFQDAGSLTILSMTTMPGNDVTHPVPDNTGYITEGQFYLYGGRIEPFGSLSRLKQAVNGRTRRDHRVLMDAMIKLYAEFRETREKKSMGFRMSSWDEKLLLYGEKFETGLMDLKVHISLEDALDRGWAILAECFDADETGIRTDLLEEFWPGEAKA